MKQLVVILILFFTSTAWGQLVTTNNQSAQQLIQNVLVGKGVSVSNITFTGSPIAIGEFDSQNANVGINNGIVITTGTVQNNGNGSHGPNNSAQAGMDNGAAGSPLLQQELGQNVETFNAATIQFNFVPYSDSVKFSYVFGSEEYHEYVGSAFNDIFAFYISGYGINGLQNMAIIPNSQDVVAINSINNGSTDNGPCKNCNFFVSNTGANPSDVTKIQYDAFTTKLEASSKVQCGQEYTLIIAIADVGDALYDSGIFLEANSLTSETPVDITYSLTQQAFPNPNEMAEGCVSATVTVERGDISQAMNIPISVSGTATAGNDYTNIPNSVNFAANQSVVQFTFDALQDAIIEGSETVIIDFDLIDPCGNPTPIQLNLVINDVQPVQVVLEDTNVYCAGDGVILIPKPTGGVGPYSFLWSTGEISPTILINPVVTTNYQVTVTDNCLNDTDTDNNTVVVPSYPPITLNESNDITEICPFLNDTLSVVASGGTGVYTYAWYADGNVYLGNNTSQPVLPSKTTTYSVIVRDECGTEDTAYVEYTILSPPLVLDMSEDTIVCPGDSAYINVSAAGGFGSFYYEWPQTGELTPEIGVAPFRSTYYVVNVSDDCQTFEVTDSVFIKVVKPLADFRVSSQTIMEGLPITFQNLTLNGVSYEWDFGDGQSSTLTHPNNTYAGDGSYTVSMIATDFRGCKDTVAKPIRILEEVYLYIPNTFTPDGDDHNGTFKVSAIGLTSLEIEIYNRWGQMIYTSDAIRFEWDGKNENNEPYKQDVYTYIVKYTTLHDDRNLVKQGHVTLLR